MPTIQKRTSSGESIFRKAIDYSLHIGIGMVALFVGGLIWLSILPRKNSEIDNEWRAEYERIKDSVRKVERKKYNDSIAKINENSNFVKSIKSINNKK